LWSTIAVQVNPAQCQLNNRMPLKKKNLYLLQPQYVQRFKGNKQAWYPYSVGVLWAYAQKFPNIVEPWNLREIIFRREHIEPVLERMVSPDLCCFSVYIWNNQYCLELAKRIKQKWPGCQIVFGGPQVSSSYTKYDFIDSIVLNEGEQCLVKILETLNSNKELDLFYKLPRIDNLEEVPSPYSTGVFDHLVEQNPDMLWDASFETNRGCPYACTFCDWGGLTLSKVKNFSLERIVGDIDWLTQQPTRTLFITDANFGIFKDRDREIAKLITKYIRKQPGIEYIAINYAKMANENIFAIAEEFSHLNKDITFSMQSMNQDVLKEIKRKNMAVNNIQHLLNLSKQYDLTTYTELILGLPLETLDSWKTGISDLLDLGQHDRIEILVAIVLENTEMHNVQVAKHKMELVDSQEIVTYSDPDECPIVETAPVVKATNTMTTADMIEAYMFGWIVTHWHNANYSRLLSMYCCKVLKVSYKQFYERMQQVICNDNGIVGQTYRRHFDALTNIYSKGVSQDEELKLSNLQFYASKLFYDNIEQMVDIGTQVAKSFGNIDAGLIELQRRCLKNSAWPTVDTVNTSVDIETWQEAPCVYKIQYSNSDLSNSFENFFTVQRRKRLLDNKFIKIQ
jgi:hypothetical protein